MARDIYVNNVEGDDILNGFSPTRVSEVHGPVRTIGRALVAAGRSDRVILANTGEPYRECVSLVPGRHVGVPGFPFEIQGNGAILEGSRPLPAIIWQKSGLTDTVKYAPRRYTYPQLYLEGKPADRVAVAADAKQPPTLEPRQWCYHQHWIYFRVEPGKSIHDYAIAQPWHQTGITLYHVHDVWINDLIVQGFQLDGINAHDNVRGASLTQITSRGNGRSGIAIVGSSRARLTGCLLGSNGGAQLWLDEYSHTQIQGCEILEGTGATIHRGAPTIHLEELEAPPVPEDVPAAQPDAEQPDAAQM